MEPNIWGKHAWIFLHSVSMNYPDNPSKLDKDRYKNFFESIQYILPCEICKTHYANHINKIPINTALNSRRDLVEWLINVHNEVNKYLNKPILSYDTVIDYYKKLYNGDINITDNLKSGKKQDKKTLVSLKYNYIISIIIFITILLAFIIWKIY